MQIKIYFLYYIRYADMLCHCYNKPMLECGTVGLQCSGTVVIPGKTTPFVELIQHQNTARKQSCTPHGLVADAEEVIIQKAAPYPYVFLVVYDPDTSIGDFDLQFMNTTNDLKAMLKKQRECVLFLVTG